MKRVCNLLITGCLALALPVLAADANWKLVKDDSGIQVYLKPVVGSSFSAYRGEVTIKADLATLQRLQDDVQGSCEWIYQCQTQKLLKQEGPQVWTYSQFEMPWPVKARDSILHITTSTQADGSMQRTIESVPDYLPAENGFVRVGKTQGLWTMTPDGHGAVQVTYQLHAEPGGSVPAWLANQFVVDAPFNTLNKLREKAQAK
jgi:hypothetical protein